MSAVFLAWCEWILELHSPLGLFRTHDSGSVLFHDRNINKRFDLLHKIVLELIPAQTIIWFSMSQTVM
jgi:hypothetical protein